MKTIEQDRDIFGNPPFANTPNKPTPESHQPIFLNNFAFKEFEISSKKGKKIRFFESECFYLIYCLNNTITFYTHGKSRHIRPLENCIVYDEAGQGFYLDFITNASSSRFIVIAFNPSANTQPQSQNTCFYKFKNTFAAAAGKQTYFKGKINLHLFDKLNTLISLSSEETPNEFILEGILFHIFGLKMLQMQEESSSNIHEYGGFSPWEVEQIQKVSEYITANPGLEYTIEYLCRMTGLGPNKLQKGFKKMHGRTIIDYIRNTRLEKALELIKETNMSISEIVYSLGLSSRSYFSKIFKNKYNCSPKKFQQIQKGQQ